MSWRLKIDENVLQDADDDKQHLNAYSWSKPITK
jgi:hypothetical protein